jgi:1-acyl-sn-glycerol-3-phosphate acyltransferase
MRNIKPLFYLYQVYKYLIFFPFLGIATFICGSLAAITAIFIGHRTSSLFGVLWAKLNAYLTPMFVSVYGSENIDKKQSYIVVSNHQSQYDIFLVYGWLPVDFRWVMKIELRKVPVLGYACYKIGHVFINRKNKQAAIASLEDAKKRISGGTSIFFFPEGTRSDDGKLMKFKKGAFRMALDMDLPILPVTIVGTRNILPNKTLALFPGSAKLIINKPVDITGYSETNLDELIELTKRSIKKSLDEYSGEKNCL